MPGDDPRTFSKYFYNLLADFKREEEPLRREIAAELTRKRTAALGYDDSPTTRCMPIGLPRADLFLDGRKLPADPQPTWLGYSVGKWEGDTLVVETAGFPWPPSTCETKAGPMRPEQATGLPCTLAKSRRVRLTR